MSSEQISVESNVNATINEVKILSRLILQRILTSDAVKYLRRNNFEALHSALLSENPDAERSLAFVADPTKEKGYSYHNDVVSITMKWIPSSNEVVDLSGNVWILNTLTFNVGMGSCYGIKYEEFKTRADIISKVNEMVEEMNQMVSEPIRIMVLDNAQRIQRDETRRVEAALSSMKDIFGSREYRKYRVGLRRGGKGRAVPREVLAGIKHGRYEYSVNEGSKRRPNVKKYSVTIPENPTYLCLIKRIA